MGGPGQRRYWLLNRWGGVRAWLRTHLLPRSLCGNEHPMTPSGKLVLVCDRRRGHSGNHMDRLFVARRR